MFLTSLLRNLYLSGQTGIISDVHCTRLLSVAADKLESQEAEHAQVAGVHFPQWLRQDPFILADGSVLDRLREKLKHDSELMSSHALTQCHEDLQLYPGQPVFDGGYYRDSGKSAAGLHIDNMVGELFVAASDSPVNPGTRPKMHELELILKSIDYCVPRFLADFFEAWSEGDITFKQYEGKHTLHIYKIQIKNYLDFLESTLPNGDVGEDDALVRSIKSLSERIKAKLSNIPREDGNQFESPRGNLY